MSEKLQLRKETIILMEMELQRLAGGTGPSAQSAHCPPEGTSFTSCNELNPESFRFTICEDCEEDEEDPEDEYTWDYC